MIDHEIKEKSIHYRKKLLKYSLWHSMQSIIIPGTLVSVRPRFALII